MQFVRNIESLPVFQRRPWQWLNHLLLRLAASGWLPIRHRYPKVAVTPAAYQGKLQLELVSHCWQYAHLLRFQLASLARYPPEKAELTVTVFFNRDDTETVALLDEFAAISAPNIRWNWCQLPQRLLFRRAIGRNYAALNSAAHWIWFTDCDLMVGEGTLDTLAAQLQGRTDYLVFPETHAISALLTRPEIDGLLAVSEHLESQPHTFLHEKKAIGPLQITHGDVARELGYCRDIASYQAAEQRWQKAHEDRAFRWLLGTPGVPLSIPNVWRVGHLEKGRYASRGITGNLRKYLRKTRDIR